MQNTCGTPQLCPWQPSAGLDVVLIQLGLSAAPCRSFATAFGTLCGSSQNQSAPKGSNMDTAHSVLPEQEWAGKCEKCCFLLMLALGIIRVNYFLSLPCAIHKC